MKKKIVLFILFFYWGINIQAQSDRVNEYTVSWDTPSKNASGSMPIGNGEVGANVWMEESGNLLFYLSRTDAWSENSSLYKLGKIRVSLYPFLIDSRTTFRQYLNLEEGKIEIEIKKGTERVALDFLVDSESPVVYLQGKSSYPVQVTVSSEIWRTQTRILPVPERHFALEKCPYDSLATEFADKVASVNDRLIVYHRNEHSIYPFTIKHQGLEDGNNEMKDPLINRTMGYAVSGKDFVRIAPTILSTREGVTDFCLKIVAHTEQTASEQEWIDRVGQILANSPAFPEAADRTAIWWTKYWDKSYVVVHTPDKTAGDKITQAYILQNWMSACAGRGNYPVKFNGSIFTVDPVYTDAGKMYSPDYRLWGPDYWWQNTRLIYHPMLKSGDYDMIHVLFDHYYSNLPMMKRIARTFWGASGAVSPETATIFGTFVNHDYGWDRTGLKVGDISNVYVRHYWSSGLEIVALMLDYYQYTLDEVFVKQRLLPMAYEILSFYNTFFSRNDTGILQITPTHSLETYFNNVLNDLPNVAGLHCVIKGLQDLPKKWSESKDKELWKQLAGSLPEIPMEEKENMRVFAPAEQYNPARSNFENPELYVIYPFSLCHFSLPNKQVGIETFKRRVQKVSSGWAQDGQQAARLGLTEEAQRNLLEKLQNSHPTHRFPVVWGPNYDWTPDQDHGSNLLMTIQDMVVQSYGKTVYLLPAFPKDWDVSFKLYTFENNVVEGIYKNEAWEKRPVLKNKGNQRIKICD